MALQVYADDTQIYYIVNVNSKSSASKVIGTNSKVGKVHVYKHG